MKKRVWFWVLAVLLGTLISPCFSETPAVIQSDDSTTIAPTDQTAEKTVVKLKEVEVKRAGDEVVINKDVHRLLPKERRMYQVGSNVIRAEDHVMYTDRQIDELNQKLDQRFKLLEDRVSAVEGRLQSQENKKSVSIL